MRELAVQKFLRSFGQVDYYTPTTIALDKLKEKYAIDHKFHAEYPNLALLKYSQIESPFQEEIVQECRGIILDSADNWKVVCWTYKKFFNYGEPLAAEIDWSTARVQAKMDGSLCQLYYYDGKWHVATSGTLDASGQVNDFGKTFEELFWEAYHNTYPSFSFNPDMCYAFELTGPLNRVVVQYPEAHLTAIGGRDLSTLEEIDFSEVEQYPLHSVDDCLKAAQALDPVKNEGFVVVDTNYNRVKIKSPAYVMLHHAKDSLSKRRMCDIVRKGEYEEFRTAIDSLPELKKIFDQIKAQHDAASAYATTLYNTNKDLPSQKEFAMAVKDLPMSSLLFQMRKSGKSAQECLAVESMTTDCYMGLVGVE